MAWKNLFRKSRDAPITAEAANTKDAKRKTPDTRRFNTAAAWGSGDFSLVSNESIFAAVTRISNTFASTQYHLYKNREIQRDHPLEQMIAHSPNYVQTAYAFQQTMEAFRNTTGNAYAFVVPLPSSRGVERLDIIDPAKIEPMLNEDTGELWYRLNGKEPMYIHGREIIHTRYICTNGHKGISPVRVLFDTLEYDEKIKRFSLQQLETGIHSPITLDIPSEISGEKKTKIVEEFLEHYKQSSGQLIVLDAGAKASRLTGSVVDAKVLDIERITRNRVATVYNIPPHMLGDYTDSNYRTNEQSMLEFFQLTMLPIFTMYAQEYDKKLLTAAQRADGYRFWPDINSLLLADTATRAERNFKLVRSAGMTPNETRQGEGLPDIEGGDRLFISRDLVPLDMLENLALGYLKDIGGEKA